MKYFKYLLWTVLLSDFVAIVAMLIARLTKEPIPLASLLFLALPLVALGIVLYLGLRGFFFKHKFRGLNETFGNVASSLTAGIGLAWMVIIPFETLASTLNPRLRGLVLLATAITGMVLFMTSDMMNSTIERKKEEPVKNGT
jgi:hypothetical protein